MSPTSASRATAIISGRSGPGAGSLRCVILSSGCLSSWVRDTWCVSTVGFVVAVLGRVDQRREADRPFDHVTDAGTRPVVSVVAGDSCGQIAVVGRHRTAVVDFVAVAIFAA